jgi:ElaB/YqjD/DUF883 family membrane-anchored ribosome-binding protein
MSHATTEITKEKLFEDFNAVVAETEQLLNSLAGAGADKAGSMRASVEQGLAAAGDRAGAGLGARGRRVRACAPVAVDRRHRSSGGARRPGSGIDDRASLTGRDGR